MRRRTLLSVGLATGALLAVAGGSLALITPARRDGRFSDTSRAIFAALAPAVLGSMLPADPAARRRVVDAHVDRVEASIAGLSPALQGEVDELLTVVGSAPGRLLLAGLRPAWTDASADEIRAALAGMRDAPLGLRQQAYHALRDLTNASYFAEPATWVAIGYPGQRPV